MATLARTPSVRMRSERRFFTTMACVALLLVFIGFAPSFYLRGLIPIHPLVPLNLLVLTHGLVFSSWIILFAVQTGLVATGNIAIHRRLGLLGMAMIAIMIPLAIVTAIGGVHRPTGPPGIDPLSWLAVPLVNVPVFGGMIVTALAFRRSPVIHKRLMLIAMMTMMQPAIGRIPFPPPIRGPVAMLGLSTLVFVPLMLWDWRTRGRVHPATAWGSAIVVFSYFLTPAIWHTGWWLGFARWVSMA
ncbi:MAG: putative rane protein [Sphingomonas bacterium]|nr:putative rane protein [Sphingomonas bacterium]